MKKKDTYTSLYKPPYFSNVKNNNPSHLNFILAKSVCKMAFDYIITKKNVFVFCE